jgi:hypothetical protein
MIRRLRAAKEPEDEGAMERLSHLVQHIDEK